MVIANASVALSQDAAHLSDLDLLQELIVLTAKDRLAVETHLTVAQRERVLEATMGNMDVVMGLLPYVRKHLALLAGRRRSGGGGVGPNRADERGYLLDVLSAVHGTVDPERPCDLTGGSELARFLQAYVVKLDAPVGTLISVARDASEVCRAEICFDAENERGVELALRCLPTRATAAARRRFAVSDRVACAVADASDAWTDWAAGTVLEVDHAVDADAAKRFSRSGSRVPYRVRLDAGRDVLVHRDEHSLVRDLALQPAGPRQAAGGARTLAKFAKRQRGDEWEMVDHATRQVRKISGDRELW